MKPDLTARGKFLRFSAKAALVAVFATMLALQTRYSKSPGPVFAAELKHRVTAANKVTPLEQLDAVCAGCHREIYDRYEQTGMARGGGMAAENLLPGSFTHQPSGIEYAVFLRDGAAWMSYLRTGREGRGALEGEVQLEYAIGSGKHGRTYLYRIGHQWFELPINYYTGRNGWDMAPAYKSVRNMPEPLPVDPNCLHCHATEGQPALATAPNRFATVPFRQGGIGCRSCHGDPSAHLASNGHDAITNPGKLPAAKRDSACIQCHLEGEAVVYKPGRSLARFVPGEDLADTAVYFVRASQQGGGARATSQYEALLQSACKKAAGDRLTCTSCHDPHYDPPAAERVQYFRTRCLSCHTSPAIASRHFPEQPNCAQCHMPSRDTSDISHAQVTDHDIEARPAKHVRTWREQSREVLVPVGNAAAGDREYGLAYAQAAQRGVPEAVQTALHLLNKAAQAGNADEEVHLRLGYLNQISDRMDEARKHYKLVLEENPYEPTALANLAVIDASSRSSEQLGEAVQLLTRLVNVDPSQTKAGLNLAFIDCRLGRVTQAAGLLKRLAEFNPDDAQLREFMLHGELDGQHCSVSVDTDVR